MSAVDDDTAAEGISEAAVTFCSPVPASCSANITGTTDSAASFNRSWAVTYAVNNYNVPYGTGSGQNPFANYGPTPGNCTNFVSQAILAGLTGRTTPLGVYGERYRFDIDVTAPAPQWYFRCDCDRGSAFTGVKELYQYARSNLPTYKGLHFQFVTNDTPTVALNVAAVQVGDVVFMDFEPDGKMDHAMLVTGIDTSNVGYNKIRLTGQSDNRTNRGLGDINTDYHQKVLFYVYRPLDYKPTGL